MGQFLRRLLFSKKLEVVLVGLENSGKTTLLHVLSDGTPVETTPTIGLNVRMVRKGGVNMKCWDLGGQQQYRSEWGRFTRGCNVIIYVVDANAIHLLPEAKKELHRLLEDKELAKTALLVVANKIDLEPHASEPVLIRGNE
jgi:Arf/Sar family protein